MTPAAARASLMRIHDALLPCERRFLEALPELPEHQRDRGLTALLERYAHMLAEPDHETLAERYIKYHAGRS